MYKEFFKCRNRSRGNGGSKDKGQSAKLVCRRQNQVCSEPEAGCTGTGKTEKADWPEGGSWMSQEELW